MNIPNVLTRRIMLIPLSLFLLAGATILCAPQTIFQTSLRISMTTTADAAEIAEADQRQTRLEHAQRLHQEALELLQKGQYAQALLPAQEALRLQEAIYGPGHIETTSYLNTVGLILHQQAELKEAQAILQEALAIRERELGPTHPAVAESLTNVARVLYANGQFAEAQPLLERGLRIREPALGKNHPDTAVTLTHLGNVQMQMGDLAGAEANLKRAVHLLEHAGEPRSVDLAMALNIHGNIRGRRGDYAGARPLFEQSLDLRKRTLGPTHPHVARTLTRLGTLSARMGDLDRALPYLERALTIHEKALGSENPEVAGSLIEVGRIRRLKGDLVKAKSLFERALSIQERTLGRQHPFVAVTLAELAQVHQKLDNVPKARSLLKEAIQVQESSVGRDHPFLADKLTTLAYLEGGERNFTETERHLAHALKIRQATLRPSHPDIALSLLDLARAKHVQGQLPEARHLYEQAREILLAHNRLNADLDDQALSQVWRQQLRGLQHYLLLLATLSHTSLDEEEHQSVIADGFLVAEQARGWIVRAALAKAAARREAGSEAQLRLTHAVETLRQQRQGLWNQLDVLRGKPIGQRNEEELLRLKEQEQQIQQRLDVQLTSLETSFPRYAELAMPKPTDAPSVQELLNPGEALVSFYSLEDRLQIWVAKSGQKLWYGDVPITRTKLKMLVDDLRSSLTVDYQPFDVISAAKLYQKLFAPLEHHFKGVKKLILIPDDVLLPLPFSALTRETQSESYKRLSKAFSQHERLELHSKLMRSYADLDWLVKRFPITVLPSASTLRLLRGTPIGDRKAKEPFWGFGDPILSGTGQTRGGAMLVARGSEGNMKGLRSLDKLPGTQKELIAIAKALSVDPDRHLFLRERATERQVKKLNASGELGETKVLYFATHGLLAGQLQGLTQPALVFTPPDNPTDEDDGLLAMDEILQLRIPSAEWVVLSACNTSGGDGSGDGLTGLAQAFFFAGGKALLVSHWSVSDRPTQTLMTEVFRRYGRDGSLPKTEAMRQGMLALMEQGREGMRAYFAHPYAWAPFFLVGDGS